MTKVVTIASMVRTAAKSETDFIGVVTNTFEEGDLQRAADFFEKMNIPRSTGAEGGLLDDIHRFGGSAVTGADDFEVEYTLSAGIQKFLDRHERKIKWHSTHPSIEGAQNVLLLVRGAIMATNLRLERLRCLLASKDELNPREWRIARELMNRSYLSFRNFLRLTGGVWIDAMQQNFGLEELNEAIGNFYELVDQAVRTLEDHKEAIEERRLELTVIPPEGLPPVKPPVYFSGDLLGRGPWKQFWAQVNSRAHNFRESIAY